MIDHETEILLTRYLDGDLEPAAVRRLIKRIETEPELGRTLETMESLRRSIRQLAVEDQPPDELDALVRPLRRGGRPWGQRWVAVALTSAAAAVVIGLIVVSEIGRTGWAPWAESPRPKHRDHFVLSNLPERDDDAPMGRLEKLLAEPFAEPDLPELEPEIAIGPLEAPPGTGRVTRVLDIEAVSVPLPDALRVDSGDWIVEIVGGRVVSCREPGAEPDASDVPSTCKGLVGLEPVPVDDGSYRASVIEVEGNMPGPKPEPEPKAEPEPETGTGTESGAGAGDRNRIRVGDPRQEQRPRPGTAIGIGVSCGNPRPGAARRCKIPAMNVITGLEMLMDDGSPLAGRRWGLLANHAAVASNLEPARTVLQASCGAPTVVFAPEHGLEGVAQDMEGVEDSRDPLTGIPIRSLYGHDVESLKARADDVRDLDAVAVDVPDIGTRYYTFAASMDGLMAACETVGVEVVVLDRPNPIGGLCREGGRIRPGFESFVSQLPAPARHGLTLGEIALLLQRERYPGVALTVIPCRGWRRSQLFDETGLPWVPPSPNMPTLETALIYPGLCLIEATTLSEGRGTTRPFHLVGAPWVDARALVDRLRALDLPGIAFRAAWFRPEFQKHAGEICSGVELHVTDRDALEPLALGLRLVQTIHDLHPEDFGWRPDPYEFIGDVPALDLLTGSPDARETIEQGGDVGPLLRSWEADVETFNQGLDGILLYHEA